MREVVAGLQGSRIREVANEGIGREGVLAFWFGESDEVTPEPIREAAIASLRAGETFYAHNLGLPELRQAIAGYTERLHPGRGESHWFERIAVTSGGVNGLMLAAQTLVDAGDDVVVLTPAWPNLVAQPQIMGARVRTVSLVPRAGAWTLDLDALRTAITPATRVLIVNAPANPTGFTPSSAPSWRIAAPRAPGSWPTRSMSACTSRPTPPMIRRRAAPSRMPPTGGKDAVHRGGGRSVRQASWTWPSPTTA